MSGAGGNTRGDLDGDRNNQHGDVGFCTFIFSAKPLSSKFFCSLICFGAGLGLMSYGIASYILQAESNTSWRGLIYVGTGVLVISSGAVALGKLCGLYRSFRRHQEQTGQNFVLQGNLGPQQAPVWTTGQYTTPYPLPYGPGQEQPPPGYAATVGPEFPEGAYPRQQLYPQAGGAVPHKQQPQPVQTDLSDGTSQALYPPAAHVQQLTTNEPSAPLPPSYDEVFINEQNK